MKNYAGLNFAIIMELNKDPRHLAISLYMYTAIGLILGISIFKAENICSIKICIMTKNSHGWPTIILRTLSYIQV